MSSVRAGFFVAIALIALFAPPWLFFVCAGLYAFWQRAYELILLGMFVDAQFGLPGMTFAYTYTLVLGLMVLIAESIKPYLMFYRT